MRHKIQQPKKLRTGSSQVISAPQKLRFSCHLLIKSKNIRNPRLGWNPNGNFSTWTHTKCISYSYVGVFFRWQCCIVSRSLVRIPSGHERYASGSKDVRKHRQLHCLHCISTVLRLAHLMALWWQSSRCTSKDYIDTPMSRLISSNTEATDSFQRQNIIQFHACINLRTSATWDQSHACTVVQGKLL
jgi:hypothetical protein